jgi:hypothetical protein
MDQGALFPDDADLGTGRRGVIGFRYQTALGS